MITKESSNKSLLLLLPNNETVNSKKHCSQLENLETVIEQKRSEIENHKGIYFIRLMRGLMHLRWKFGWEVRSSPPCSPDIAPSNFHIFFDRHKHLFRKHFRWMIRDVIGGRNSQFARKMEKDCWTEQQHNKCNQT